jgi:hypothetical protein
VPSDRDDGDEHPRGEPGERDAAQQARPSGDYAGRLPLKVLLRRLGFGPGSGHGLSPWFSDSLNHVIQVNASLVAGRT